ncbi:hypothetical protein [Micromonospora sp. NBC_01796]|uniref:hypothetical protein n=1 Tax=Micromonospora sp. NBC_01796 TaxID=2975987 RepID=UPI002DDB081D|nr:hypothetical protein [Micromonospora sp. NBC_01796]WSA86764.1 hypothetical protein OIE47_03825 [Micromonospora sp. NBC_01796]
MMGTLALARPVGGRIVRLTLAEAVHGCDTAAVSWSLFVVPLDGLSQDGMSDWIASAEFTRGIPEQVPQALPRPSVAEVLDAFEAAGCHGTNWFEVVGEDAGSRLPECPSPGTCASTGGLDLGEVSVYSSGETSSQPAVLADAAVETVAFRKPNPVAVLRAVCALASYAGPQLVFDESADQAFAVWPGEAAGELEDDWPW